MSWGIEYDLRYLPLLYFPPRGEKYSLSYYNLSKLQCIIVPLGEMSRFGGTEGFYTRNRIPAIILAINGQKAARKIIPDPMQSTIISFIRIPGYLR
jgi:hypothetical protein